MKSINRRRFIEEFIKIKDKTGSIVPLKFNVPQEKFYAAIKRQAQENKPIRLIVLKARQEGISTATEGIIFTNVINSSNKQAGIITHKDEATNNLYNMTKLMYNNMPENFRPQTQYSNAKELVFNNDKGTGLNSSIRCMTAGSSGVGRSYTFHFLHISEYAFWPGKKHETLSGLLATVPDLPGTMVIIESTANGYEDFKERWDKAVSGESDYIPVFIGWNELPEYQTYYDGFELTDEEKELKLIYNLSNEQIAWRRRKINTECNGDINMFKQEYPICPEEAFLGTGTCIFDKAKLINRLEQIKDRKPLKKGTFLYDKKDLTISNIRFIEDDKGCIEIYEMPKDGYPYVLSGDTAGLGSDEFCGDVFNNITCEQVASLTIETDEDLYADQMYCLGKLYNNALIGIENNYSTYPTKMLWNMGYTNQYQREIDNSISIKMQDKIGWATTVATRPVLLAVLTEFIRENVDKINNPKTIRQCLIFIKKENGKKEAENGYHDDRVMTFGIGLMIREQQDFFINEEQEDQKIEWPDPLKTADDEDYYDDEAYMRW